MPALSVKMNKQMLDIWKVQHLKKVRLVVSFRACGILYDIGKTGIQIPKTRASYKNKPRTGRSS